MQKFFVTNQQIEAQTIIINGEDVNHIVNVLRLQIGENIIVCNKETGISYITCINKMNKNEVECKIQSVVEETTESNISVVIYQGLPKAEKMEYIIQKTTELGVKQIVPLAMRRCVVKLNGKDEQKKITRWQKIAEVAAKQSGRDCIPKISNVITIKELQDMVKQYDLFLVAYEEEKDITLKRELQLIKDISKDGKVKIGVLVGPEGGIEKEEVELLKREGAKVITLGKRILRTETAPITIMSNIVYELEM